MKKRLGFSCVLVLAMACGLWMGCGGSGDKSGGGSDCNCPKGYPLACGPNAREVCDGVDNNCNGQVDEKVAIHFPDPNLQEAIWMQLPNPLSGSTCCTVYNNDFCLVDSTLFLNGWGITNLSGIEYAVYVKALVLDDNSITNLTPLASLPALSALYINNNQVNNLTPLSKLHYISVLMADTNDITDLTPISGLTKLGFLNVGSNPGLYDLSALTNLHLLQSIVLDSTSVTDLQPLDDNYYISSGDSVYVRNDTLDEISCCTYIPDMVNCRNAKVIDGGYCAANYPSCTPYVCP